MSVYDVRLKRLAVLLLPTFMRKPALSALAQAMAEGANLTLGTFMRWRQEKEYRLRHNGQTCHLRALLNDLFDPGLRRIGIEDGWTYDFDGQRVFLRETGGDLALPARPGGIILSRRGYGGSAGYDFRIIVPPDLKGAFDEARLNAVTRAFRLASKRWTIDYRNIVNT